MFLFIEFLDELVQGFRDTAWPAIRDDLTLSYTQIGLILWLPRLFGNLLEPLLFVLADAGYRRRVICAGALAFAISLVLIGLATGFWMFILATMLFYPASGAFVSLMQATLMDRAPDKRERNMALWTAAGSAGNLVGPLIITAFFALSIGWRPAFILVGLLALPAWLFSQRYVTEHPRTSSDSPNTTTAGLLHDLGSGLMNALRVMKQDPILLTLLVLEAADSMADVFSSFLTLFLVASAGFTLVQAGLAMACWTAAMLLGNLLLIPLLKRYNGLRMVRVRAFALLLLYPLFLIVPSYGGRLLLLVLIGLAASGWYPILSARLFSLLPGRSGTVQAINSIFGALAGIVPFGLGLIADSYGITITMWLLCAGIVIVAAIPFRPSTLD